MPGNPLDIADVRLRVEKSLQAFLADARPRLDAAGEDMAYVADALADLVSGGKRLRPAFCYWGWRGAGGADDETVITAATSLELLHACAIVHDDVMDRADTRRGMLSVHKRFAGLHRSAGWQGDADGFGVGAAILLGDLCLAWSDQMFTACGLPADAVLRARPAYDAMRTEVMAGQYLDLLEQARSGGSVDRAMRVLRFKSAKYTVERPLHVGGLLAGAGDAVLAAYTAYGLPVGEAFQLRDDVLGVFGDPDLTGKPAGDDLREGKRTVLVAAALERATDAQRDTLQQLVGNPELDTAGVDTLRGVITDSGALAEVERLIAALAGVASTALDAAPIDDDARAVLHALADAAISRSG